MRRLGAEGGGSEVGAKAKEEGQKESGYDRKLRSLGQEDQDPMEVEMATHSSILAWKIPWTEEPGRLQSKESDMTERLSTHRQETGVSLTWV